MALQIQKGKNQAKPEAAQVAPVTEEVKAPVVEETKAEAPATPADFEFGKDRKKLAFVRPLGDPSNKDTTRLNSPDGTASVKTTPTIVGYKFKVLEDLRIPDCGTNEGFKNDPMNFENPDNWIDVKAGTEVNLTPYETALLLSQPEFNGGCDGGEKPVICVYMDRATKSRAGEVARVSSTTRVPRVSLRAATGSIKDFDIEHVLEYEVVKTGNTNRKIRTLNPGFEKWAPLAMNKPKKTSSATASSDSAREVAHQGAQSFLAYVNRRKQQS